MMSFNNYLQFRQVESKINSIASRIVENQAQGNPATAQALDQAKQQLMGAFEQQFKSDPSGALSWLNSLYTTVLPQDYKTKYGEYQKSQGQQPQQQSQQPQQQQQQQQQGQQPQQQQPTGK
jgi:hypothetical protein